MEKDCNIFNFKYEGKTKATYLCNQNRKTKCAATLNMSFIGGSELDGVHNHPPYDKETLNDKFVMIT